MSVAEKINSEITQTENKIIQPKKMGLLVENPVYKPFRYPWCYDAWPSIITPWISKWFINRIFN